MYSESLFCLLREVRSNLLTLNSDTKVEHMVFQELSSPLYETFRKTYISEDLEFPSVTLTNCPIISGKNLGVLPRANAVTFKPSLAGTGDLTICKNYIMSTQHLREELMRESTLAFEYRRQEEKENPSLQKELTKFAQAAVKACTNELRYG